MLNPIYQEHLKKIIKYCSVGVINTLASAGVMYIFARLGYHYTIYTACGYLVGFFTSFFLNLSFTFRVQGNIKKRMSVFLIINLLNLIQVEIVQIILIEYAKQPHLLAILVGLVYSAAFGFLMNQRYVFQPQTA